VRRTEFALRVLVIYIAGALGAVDAAGALSAPFAVLSIFLTAELATRARNRPGLDRLVRVPGVILVSLVLGGLVLNLLPAGLTRQTWSAFWVVFSLVVLWWKRNERTSLSWIRTKPGANTVWFSTTGVILVAATIVATVGANEDLKSPLQMWVQGQSQGAIVVAIGGDAESGGPYRLSMDPMVTKTDAFDPFSLDAGESVERSLPAGGNTRYRISLVDDRTGQEVRALVVDSTPISG
jgi:hypothetical protein